MARGLEEIAGDGGLRRRRGALVMEHPRLTGLERVELVGDGPDGCEIDLRFLPSLHRDKAPAPPLDPEDVSVRARRPDARAQVARSLRRLDEQVVRAAFPPLAVLTGGDALDGLVVELRASPSLDPMSRAAHLPLAPAHAPRRPARIRPRPPEGTDVDYLARDYEGYRGLMLDRMAALLPQWPERHAADVGVAIVETLAYAADELSYFQDAVATEAYLATARRRVSVKRHARLLDHRMHEGCASRAWVRIEVSAPCRIRKGLMLRCSAEAASDTNGRGARSARASADRVAFETLADAELRPGHARMDLYAWGAADYAVPAGATTAALVGRHPHLRAGDVLVLAVVADPLTGERVDDPALRRAVRLRRATRFLADPLTGVELTELNWAAEDAPTSPLPVAASVAGRRLARLSEAWGNVVPADAGLTVEEPAPRTPDETGAAPWLELRSEELIYAVPYDEEVERGRPASAFTAPDPRLAQAQVVLREPDWADRGGAVWRPAADLLGAGPYARAFVAETESDGTTRLRFGDGRHGRLPSADRPLHVRARIGPMDMNIGPESLVDWVAREAEDAAITAVSNPMAAQGGVLGEPVAEVKLRAPGGFRSQRRCVLPQDYARAARDHPLVADAVAHVRRAGSHPFTLVRILPRGGGPPSPVLLQDVRDRLEPLRLIDDAFEVCAPVFAPLEVRLAIDVESPYAPSEARRRAAARVRGLLAAEDMRFGGSVVVGPVTAAALREEGVSDVRLLALRRLGSLDDAAPATGRILLRPWEVAQIDDVLTAAGRGVLHVEARRAR